MAHDYKEYDAYHDAERQVKKYPLYLPTTTNAARSKPWCV